MGGVVGGIFGRMVPHGELNPCIELLEEGMNALRKTPFHDVLGRDFLHQTSTVAKYMIDFHRTSIEKINVAALYFEMNGFTINPDRWYFDGFAYKTAEDVWELEWLAHWDADTDSDSFTLTGMESVQEAFALYYCDESQPLSVKMAAELADHLVTARFMQLIAAAHALTKQTDNMLDGLPVLATAHDWDVVHQTR